MSFDKLMAELDGLASEQETMSKALPAGDGEDDKNIQAAAAEGGDMDGEGDGAGGKPDGDGAGEGEGDGEGETLGKSLGTVTLEDGKQVEAVDGTELVKSLMGQLQALGTKQAEGESQMFKALEQCVGLVKGQADLIKSMQGEIAKLRGEGRGRKTVLAITEKPGAGEQMNKSEPSGMTGSEFMAKSHAAFDAKKITGQELTTIDVALRTGAPVSAELIQKVVS
ncbi:hypothetical protein [Bordetella phage vB_BbrM_PHB04]|uniref:Uncharacterized protein n=1 Tax=Bordetella phage vB_BbrM_PHB04 TaxID=2029657 RepID=A0A291L9W2_9CAUD|nr:hypothetical protein HOS14_gp021 [Bordetella phage vB_BbrM_PHB04]ATI15639.1 hypothetical protein [Bordetella phage vB_BbrM_PHB04]